MRTRGNGGREDARSHSGARRGVIEAVGFTGGCELERGRARGAGDYLDAVEVGVGHTVYVHHVSRGDQHRRRVLVGHRGHLELTTMSVISSVRLLSTTTEEMLMLLVKPDTVTKSPAVNNPSATAECVYVAKP